MTGTSVADREQGMTLVELLVAMMVTSILLVSVGAVFTGALKTLLVVNAKGDLTSDAQLGMNTITFKVRAAHGVLNAAGQAGPIVVAGAAGSITFRADLPQSQAASWATAQISPWNAPYATTLGVSGLWPYSIKYAWSNTGCGTGSVPSGVTEQTAPAVFVPTGASAGSFTYPTYSPARCVLRTTSNPGISFRYLGSGADSAGNATSGCVLPDSATPTRWPAPSQMPATLVTAIDLASVKSIEVTVVAKDAAGRQVSLLNQICLTN